MWWILLLVFINLNIKCRASDICDGSKCIQKCCPDKQYVLDRKKCINYDKDLDVTKLPVFNEELYEIGRARDFFSTKYGAFLDNKFKASAFKMMNMSTFLMSNGTIRLQGKLLHFRKIDQYCIDYNVYNTSTGMNHRDKIIVWATYTQDDSYDIPIFFKCGILISCVFLILVLVVYTILPELRKLGGLILMAYVTSLLFGFIFLFTIQVGVQSFSVSTCLAITLLVYYFLIASFAWMNVMSYDIWWTFRGYAKARPIHRRGEQFKFRIYCLYSWGMPLLLTVAVGLLNDSSTGSSAPNKFIRPRIPRRGCFIDNEAKLAYLYGPMSIMIVLNWVFYFMTAFNIWRLSRGADMLNSADSSATGSASARRNNKQRYMIYLKLSILMGLSWILEVVSSLHKNYRQLWYLSDAYNVFIGLVIFILFVCKKKIYMKLKKRFKDHKAPASFKSRSRNTTDSNPLQSPLKTQDASSIFQQP